jgi:hypothetical protein
MVRAISRPGVTCHLPFFGVARQKSTGVARASFDFCRKLDSIDARTGGIRAKARDAGQKAGRITPSSGFEERG